MEKTKDREKIAFYKKNRKINPKIINEQLRKMWLAKKEAANPKPVEVKPEVKPEVEVKVEAKTEVKAEVKPVSKVDDAVPKKQTGISEEVAKLVQETAAEVKTEIK